MDDLMNTLLLGAVAAAFFPIAFLMARLCLEALVRALPAKRLPASGRVLS
jgi:hypothetical protein